MVDGLLGECLHDVEVRESLAASFMASISERECKLYIMRDLIVSNSSFSKEDFICARWEDDFSSLQLKS